MKLFFYRGEIAYEIKDFVFTSLTDRLKFLFQSSYILFP